MQNQNLYTLGDMTFLRRDPLYKREKPYLVLLPNTADVDPSIPRHNLQFEKHQVELTDIRGRENEYRIDECGFQYICHRTAVRVLLGLQGDGPTLPDVHEYKVETERTLKSFFNAVRVVCYDFRIRENVEYYRSEIDLNDPLLREGPAQGAHTDVTARSGPEMIRHRLGEEDFRTYRNPTYRFRIVNTWRPLNDICQENPLSLCDYRSVDPQDLTAADRVTPERAGEVYYIHHNRNQKWHWLRNQRSDELTVFVLYDDQPGNQAKCRWEDLYVRSRWQGPFMKKLPDISFGSAQDPVLSLETKSHWLDFVKKLEKIRRDLVVLNARLKYLSLYHSYDDEIKLALLEIFTSLIRFWVASVKWMRSNPLGQVAQGSKSDSKFLKLFEEVEAAMEHFEKLSTAIDPSYHDRIERMDHEKRMRQAEFANNVGVSDDLVVYPVHMLPSAHHSAVFHGRTESLTLIGTHLDGNRDSLRSVLVHGLGGVGKTQTALQYAHRNSSKYDAIFWIQSETFLSINASITKIARGLRLPGSMRDGADEQNLAAFQSWQQAAKRNGRQWLMIFDNVEKLEDILPNYVPTTNGSIIITSRYPDCGLQTSFPLALKPFKVEEGAQLLKQYLKYPSTQLVDVGNDERALKSLSERVDGLPLGLRAIAGLMNARKSMTASKFMGLYDKGSRKLLKSSARVVDYDPDTSRVIGKEHVLDRIWHMSFDLLEDQVELDDTPKPRLLLGMCALLCPDGIPLSLLGQTSDHSALSNEAPSPFGDEVDLDSATVALTQMALIDCDDSRITIHRLVQDAYIYYHLDSQRYEELENALNTSVSLLFHSFPRQINGRPMHDNWKQCNNLIQHAKWLADRCAEIRSIIPKFHPPPDTTELLKSCAWFLFEMADHRTAIHVLEISKELCLDQKSELYAHLLNTNGCCAFELNDLTTCRQDWEKALAIREIWAKRGVPGAEEELANQLNNFGNLESGEGRYDSALEFFGRAKKIRLRLGKEAIVPLGVSHMTTGRAYFLKGMHAEALQHYKSAENIFLDHFGVNGHFMAHLNYAYGNLNYAQGDTGPAKSFYTLAQKILEEDTPYHLLLAACNYKLACLEAAENKSDAALVILEKALAIAEFRDASGDIARILKKKAAILFNGNEEERARAQILTTDAEKFLAKQRNLVMSLEEDGEDEWNLWVCPYWSISD
ncbi:hypothetical protein GQX73_g5174 [Xylaria multiplex]|uniref:Uncharacterized protein n=1 Tax=Xylaria multiplex TaxID=323545 RepID=A0A7C8MTU4_9PEZI|nr:hypothetical protein GQX73_g5174 [Xylaria multiplex]